MIVEPRGKRMDILFLCRANTGRSQMAEAIFNKLAKGKHAAASAGTKVNDKQHALVEQRPNMEALLQCMDELGLDIRRNIRKEITPEMLAAADKAIIMAEPETVPDYLAESPKSIYWKVLDPKGMNYEGVLIVRKVIEERITLLLQELEAAP